MSPKEVFDAQTEEPKMTHNAVRKLLREMTLSVGLRCDNGRYSLPESFTAEELKVAPRKEFHRELVALIERHRRRHTISGDFIWGLEKVLNEERARSKPKT